MKGFFRAVKYIIVGLVLAIVFLFYLHPPEPVRDLLGIKDMEKRERQLDKSTPKGSLTDVILVAGKRLFNWRQANKHNWINPPPRGALPMSSWLPVSGFLIGDRPISINW